MTRVPLVLWLSVCLWFFYVFACCSCSRVVCVSLVCLFFRMLLVVKGGMCVSGMSMCSDAA